MGPLPLLRAQLRYELQEKYVGSIAGVWWAVLNPVFQVTVYVVLVTTVFKAKFGIGGTFDYLLFVCAGMSVWLVVQESLISAAGSLVRHSDIVKNVALPLQILPAASVLASLVSLSLTLTVTVVMALASGRPLGASLVLFPLILGIQTVLTLGLALVLSTITVFVRDFTYILPLLLQVLTFMTPILYPLEFAPRALRVLSEVNPFFQLVDAYRALFLRGDWPDAVGLAYLAVLSTVLLGVGWLVFSKARAMAEALV